MPRRRFSQNLFYLLFCISLQTKQIRSFVFWEKLRRDQNAFGLIWPLVFHFSELSIWLANFYSSRGIKYVHSFLSKGSIALASKKEAFLCVFTAVPFDYGTLFSFRDGKHCAKLNMNEKKMSKSQFNFLTLLGPCSMLKKLSKKISFLGHRR